jgi:hypothetical protein
MGKFTVFANGRSVAGKATDHMAFCTAPDMCKLPNNVPAPFPNFVMSTKIAKDQTTHTTILKKPIWVKPTEAGPPSEPAHPGVNKGVKSNTYRAEAKATSYSDNVIVEGSGVVRMLDLTTQNHENTVGIITNAALLAQLLADFEAKYGKKAVPPDDTKGKAPGTGGPPQGPKPGEKGPGKKEGAPAPAKNPTNEQCFLEQSWVTCSHTKKGARTAYKGGTLECVGSETVSLGSKVQGVCGEHTSWTITGWAQDTRKGEKASYPVNMGAPNGTGLALFLNLQTVVPHEYGVTALCCKGVKEVITVKVYPSTVWEFTLETPEWKKLLEEKCNNLFKKLGIKVKLIVCAGKVALGGKWQEDEGSPRACFEFSGSGSLDPLIGATGRYNLLNLHPAVRAVVTAAAALGIKLEIFVELGGKITLGINGKRHFGCGKGEVAGSIGGEVSLTVGALAGVFNKLDPDEEPIVSAEAAAQGGVNFTGRAKAETQRPVKIVAGIEGKLLETKGWIKLNVSFGKYTSWVPEKWRPKWLTLKASPSWECTFFDEWIFMPADDHVIWPRG